VYPSADGSVELRLSRERRCGKISERKGWDHQVWITPVNKLTTLVWSSLFLSQEEGR
jgi:hypothetical protein